MSPRHFAIVASLWLAAHVIDASAQDAAAFVWCEPAQDRVVIEYRASASEAESLPIEAGAERIDFFPLVEHTPCASDPPGAEDACRVTGHREHLVSCQLRQTRYTLKFSPGVGNINLLGRCGADVTGRLSIVRDDRELVEELWFEDDNCHERKLWLRRIELYGDERAPLLQSALYSPD